MLIKGSDSGARLLMILTYDGSSLFFPKSTKPILLAIFKFITKKIFHTIYIQLCIRISHPTILYCQLYSLFIFNHPSYALNGTHTFP